uniref:zinc-ribbon domain-containing protein n=1 Tax=Waltera sp. TaxID=2815806 RepID=UPI003AF16527
MADKLVRGKNDLSSLYPELAAEWDHEKNEGLDPDMVLPGSGKRVWWKCACGHEWKTAIYHRTAGHGCKICASRKAVLKPGVNDLATRCPELSEDWDFEKNDPLGPSDVPMYSQASVWWKCSKGHSWKNTVSHRIQGQGCPYCAGNRILPGFNDIVTLKVSYLKDWDFRKNHDVKPEMLGPGSTKKVWWRCPKGHSWEAAVYSRTAGSGCPYCAGNRLVPGVNDIATAFPELVSEWDYDRNNGITPDMVAKTAARSYWWICPQGHSYSSSPGSRARGCGCIYCAGKRLMKGFNDFASQYPELLKEWDWDKNAGIKPDEIPCNRHKKVWWTDSQGHSWKATTSNRIRGCGCPYCANRVVLQGFNDLSTLQPDLAKEWDYERNAPLKPDMI